MTASSSNLPPSSSNPGTPAAYLAVDLGASSGRMMLGTWDGARFGLREVRRFPNGPVAVRGHLHWDVLRLWSEITRSIADYAAEDGAPLAGIGIDTWAVDFALLDRAGNLLGNPYHYRDRRTDLLAELGLPAGLLPEVVAPGTPLGELLPHVHDATGLRHPTPVIATATHDTASAVAAVPGLNARSAYTSSGTWSLVGIEIDQPVLSEEARRLNVTNEGGVGGTIRLLKKVAGPWLLQECQRHWQRAGEACDWPALVALAEAAPLRTLADPDAPEFLNPDDMPTAIQAYCRRTGQPVPESIGAVARCYLDSLALKYRWSSRR
jgi:sugar (pentulose or hexulose) kinase